MERESLSTRVHTSARTVLLFRLVTLITLFVCIVNSYEIRSRRVNTVLRRVFGADLVEYKGESSSSLVVVILPGLFLSGRVVQIGDFMNSRSEVHRHLEDRY